MYSLVLFGLCVYFFIKFIIDLVNFGYPFGPAQWGMVALCVVFLPIMFFMGKRAIKDLKKSKETQAEDADKQREELEKRKREIYLGDDYDVPDDDETDNDIDDEAGDETDAGSDDKTIFDE